MLNKLLPSKIMGIDCSTHTLAYSVFNDKKLLDFGELTFSGSTVFDRLAGAKTSANSLLRYEPEVIVIESAVMVASAATAIKMAYVFGAVIGELQASGAKIVEVSPLAWQSFIGNKILSKAEKAKLKIDHPDKSVSWYKNAARQERKSRTLNFANKLHSLDPIVSDNIGDAIGIGYYFVHKGA